MSLNQTFKTAKKYKNLSIMTNNFKGTKNITEAHNQNINWQQDTCNIKPQLQPEHALLHILGKTSNMYEN